jgi:hypothetical protein
MDLTALLNDPQLISGLAALQGAPVSQAATLQANLLQQRQAMAEAKRELQLREEEHDIRKRAQNLELSQIQQKFKVQDAKMKLMQKMGLISPEEYEQLSTGLAGSIGRAGGVIPQNAVPQGLAGSISQAMSYPLQPSTSPEGGREAGMTPNNMAALLALEGDFAKAYELLNPQPATMTPYQEQQAQLARERFEWEKNKPAMTPYQQEMVELRRREVETRKTNEGRATSPISVTQMESLVANKFLGMPFFVNLATGKNESVKAGELNQQQKSFMGNVTSGALELLKYNPGMSANEAIDQVAIEEGKHISHEVVTRGRGGIMGIGEREGEVAFHYLPQVKRRGGAVSAPPPPSSAPSATNKYTPTEENLKYTAEKHGITIEQVKERMRKGGRL